MSPDEIKKVYTEALFDKAMELTRKKLVDKEVHEQSHEHALLVVQAKIIQEERDAWYQDQISNGEYQDTASKILRGTHRGTPDPATYGE